MSKAVYKVMKKNQYITDRAPPESQGWCVKAFRAMAKAENAKHMKKLKQEKNDDNESTRKQRRRSPTSFIADTMLQIHISHVCHWPLCLTFSDLESVLPYFNYDRTVFKNNDRKYSGVVLPMI